jgi:hypothetical protein
MSVTEEAGLLRVRQAAGNGVPPDVFAVNSPKAPQPPVCGHPALEALLKGRATLVGAIEIDVAAVNTLHACLAVSERQSVIGRVAEA